MFWKTGQKRP